MNILILKTANTEEVIDEAISVLDRGGIIAYPTETFYGLGVRFDMPESLKRLYDIKKRPIEKAMPLIIGDVSQLRMIVDNDWLSNMPDDVNKLIKTYWPGPLTILMPARSGLSEFLIGPNNTVAVRIPGEPFALRLAKKSGFPFTATSANISGMPPADEARRVIEYFDYSLDLLIDGGKTPGRLPSTVIDATVKGFRIIREGILKIGVP